MQAIAPRRARTMLAGWLVSTLATAAITGPVAAEFSYQSYQPYSIRQIIEDQRAILSGQFDVAAAAFKYKVAVRYLGEQRRVRPHVKELIVMWTRAFQLAPEVAASFKREIQVKEGDHEYWLPIQDVLRPDLRSECGKGCDVDLYLMWLGAAKGEWVFVVNAFRARDAGGP